MIDRRVFLQAAALVAVPGSTALAKPPLAPPTVLLVGDSHVHLMERFFRAEAAAHRVASEVVKHGGSSVRQFLQKKWVDRALERWPDVRDVLVCLGTNATRVERPKLVKDIQEFVSRLHGRSCTWLLPPYHLDYLERAVSVCELVAYSPGTLPLERDGIHATPHGYEMWARRIAEVEWE